MMKKKDKYYIFQIKLKKKFKELSWLRAKYFLNIHLFTSAGINLINVYAFFFPIPKFCS